MALDNVKSPKVNENSGMKPLINLLLCRDISEVGEGNFFFFIFFPEFSLKKQWVCKK